eukprot:GILJ01029674.1.p1 GENE.GILJ01029674.1~~GILJ01029674.1.p1  ORF type:complete len:132 (+),score=17.10 GILJ01029674.1:221-616(+)
MVDFTLQHTSLEQVFLRIANRQQHAPVAGEESEAQRDHAPDITVDDNHSPDHHHPITARGIGRVISVDDIGQLVDVIGVVSTSEFPAAYGTRTTRQVATSVTTRAPTNDFIGASLGMASSSVAFREIVTQM